ncbi:uncharacterized protein BKCO1_980001 [Diplodia corticola]|uniref:Integral membrane protein n=1 Tax=Diplodia corticola TaxID=236234 RepID=A0A1J9QJF6_9PEZI|nr:uncharacterized protein BKCO1_980001 [Diplodia corticola]OJD28998.1 integral membrane protein [Diplodia corticola]
MFHPVHRSSALLRVLAVTLIALLPSLAHAQTLIDFSSLPSCANSCTNLVNAQSGCVPPAAAVTNQQTYVSCFCQSALLPNFRAGSGADCASSCTNAADQSAIQQWYVAYCASGGQSGGVTSSATSSSATSTAATSSAADSTSTRNSNAVINDYDGDGDPSNNYEGSWISAHWKWVIMLAVIFLAMIFFSILGVWLKRRHRARRDAARSNLAAGGEAGRGSGHDMTGAIPPPPPMAHLKNANDSGTLASTLDLPNNGGGGGATSPSPAGRPRSRTNTMTRFPNGSMSNVGANGQQGQPQQPVVWGPHQHQAATHGYEYHNHPGMSDGSPGPSIPPSPVNIPSPSVSPVGGGYGGSGSSNRYSGGAGKDRSRDVAIDEVADEDAVAPAYAPAKERLRRKLSKR